MLRNYLITSFRNLLRHKSYTLINALGLAVGLACCLLIGLFIQDELGYDRQHAKADRIYRVTRDFLSPDGTVSLHLGHVAPPFGPLLEEDFAGVEHATRLLETSSLFSIPTQDGSAPRAFNEDDVFFAEENVFDVFTIPVVQGNPATALSEPATVMLSRSTAERYFGNADPIGQLLRADNQFDVRVTGVFEDFPRQSHLHPNLLISFKTLESDEVYGREGLRTNWGNNSFATYLLFQEGYPAMSLEAELPAFLDKHMGQTTNDPNYRPPSTWTHLYLQPLRAIHLHSQLDSEIEANGNIRNVYGLGLIALFLLAIAVINFTNLSTARSATRSKEVGVRKVVGATREHLRGQFLTEAVLLAVVSAGLALVLATLALPWLEQFTDKTLALSPLTNPTIWLLLGGGTLLTGLAAGFYPALVLAAFQPIRALKGKIDQSATGSAPLRKVLVVTQFAISILLVICTGVVYQQIHYVRSQALGFSKDQIVLLPYHDELNDAYLSFRQEALRNAGVQHVGRSSRTPSGRLLDSQGSQVRQGDSLISTSTVIKNLRVDHDFIPTYQMELAAGRNFSREVGTDDSLAFILNESAIRMIGWNDPQQAIDQEFVYGGQAGKIIGVVKDFHFESLHEPIVPLVMHMSRNYYNALSVKLTGGDLEAGVAHLEQTWHQFLPERPFEYHFLDENFDNLYRTEQAQGQLFLLFAGIAIFIACLGLFGLTAFSTARRLKEIGVRKVLGASVPGLVQLLSREMVGLVLVANLLAWPAAWYLMQRWLDNFAYRIDVPLWLFAAAGVLALLIALLTVGWQATRAATVNPVQVLRNE
ncbi:putative ABC transport system permease protein [Catalinimonas alkaloidigena]|uniref:Putative ABC transport system permease protein n=1 Tax=Catalinimonas alkaloidigena TaxID=1075417 RepID=A0A1G9T241_9BACT|nr:ABC transporter permease [Catalinimonas alkaloidigena]SDM41712.1 putative ABC transport system permease protein [Catalinimonas alkaloidigena]